MVHFYSKKCIFRWGLKRAPPRYISVEKYAGTDRVKRPIMLFFVISVNEYGMGLSNELLCIIIAQEAAKL